MCLKCEKTQKMVLLSQKVSLSTRSITCMMNAPVNHQRSGGGKYEKQKYEKIHAKSSIRSPHVIRPVQWSVPFCFPA